MHSLARIMKQFFVIWITSWIIKDYPVLAINTAPVLMSSKHWHAFEDDPVGSIVTRLKARDMERDPVIFTLESPKLPAYYQNSKEDIHSYFSIDKRGRVRVAKPLIGLTGEESSKDYILRVRMNDGHSSPISEVRLQIMVEPQVFGRGPGTPAPNIQQARKLIGRQITPLEQAPKVASLKSEIPVGNYGIVSTVTNGNNFGFISSLWGSHPPLLQVNRTWEVEADAPVGTLVDTVRVREAVPGNDYNLTLHGTEGLLKVDPFTGKVTVAASLIDQTSDLTIMVSVHNSYGDSSEPVVLRVLPITTTTSTMSTTTTIPTTTATPITTSKSLYNRIRLAPLPSPVEVRGQLIVTGKENQSSEVKEISSEKKEPSSKRMTAYTLICLILMPILAVVCFSSMSIVAYCYYQRKQMRKTMTEFQCRSLAYIPK